MQLLKLDRGLEIIMESLAKDYNATLENIGIQCASCKLFFADKENQGAINEWGHCLPCDHALGDAMEAEMSLDETY